jgi:hypothetical protein
VNQLFRSPRLLCLRSSPLQANTTRCVSSNSSRPTSATRTRGGVLSDSRGIPGLVRRRWRAVDRHRAAGACCYLDRDVSAQAGRAVAPTTVGGAASPVRLAGQRPDGADQPGAYCARAPARGDVRQKPVLDPSEARALLDSIDASTPPGLSQTIVEKHARARPAKCPFGCFSR